MWQSFPFGPGPVTTEGAKQLTLMSRQLAGLMQPIVCGAFGMVRAADGRPIIYSLNNTASDEGAISVCGTDLQRRLAQTTDTECPTCDTVGYQRVNHPVTGIAFDPCAFRVTPSAQCTDANSSSSGSSAGVTGVLIEPQGFTGTWPTPWDIIFCPDTCELKIQWAYGCFYKGIFLGYWLGPPVTCGGTSGLMAARPVFRLGSRFAPLLGSPVDQESLPAEVRTALPAAGEGTVRRSGLIGRLSRRVVGRLAWAVLAILGA